ncbi:uncharacterized protein LOC144620860 [Crassostrea virginica]
MIHIPRLSEAVYTGMCVEVGLPTEIQIRREVDDIAEVLQKSTSFLGLLDGMKSGSDREGFRFMSSDIDHMAWFRDHKLICDLSQIILYRTPQHTVILMEWEDLPPGFTRLKLMTPSRNPAVKEACIIIDKETYISSTRMRSAVKVCVNIITGAKLLSSEPHGPCASVKFRGREHDGALCFRSNHWPNVALPWIQRCQQKQWPTESVLSAILKEGCHAVAISSVPSDCEKEIEWRISFSGSEQKLLILMHRSLEMTICEPDAVADACLFREMRMGSLIWFRNEKKFVALLTIMEHLLKTRITLFQAAAIERNLFRLIRDFSWFMLSQPQAISSNRERTLIYKRATNLMKLASRMSCSSEKLYLALFYYSVCAYEKSLKCLLIAQNKLCKPYAMYNGLYNPTVYSKRTAGLSLSDKMRKALADDIELLNNCTYIDELKLEQSLNSSGSLTIPTFVILNMLFVLNHYAIGDTIGAQQFLQNLHKLLLYDRDTLVPTELRDISWQILGICQQICGDYVGALDSYRRSLQETPFNDIQKATLSRIQTLNDMLVIYG